jgi:Right handed beta helix region
MGLQTDSHYLQRGRKNSGEIGNDNHMKTISHSLTLLVALLSFGSALFLALLWGSSALANTNQANETTDHVLLVDDDQQECPNAGFTTIQTAVNAAAPGDTIQVCPGTYNEQVEIAKRLTLVGVERNGKKASVVQPSNIVVNTDFAGIPTASIILVRNTSDVTIRNITVDGINNGLVCDATFPTMDGIFFRNASGEIESVAIKNMLSPQGCAFADAIDVFSTGEQAQRLTIRDSSLHDNDIGGIICIGPGINLHVLRNVITGNDRSDIGQAGIQFIGGASGLAEGNTVMNMIDGSCPNPSDCLFTSSGIGAFSTEDVKIVGNIVGNTNVGIFAGAGGGIPSNGIRVLQNQVFDTDLFDGIFVNGENSLVKDNVITNCERAGVTLRSGIHRIQKNTINEAAIGLRVHTEINIAGNQFFNTPVIQEVFVPGAPAESNQDSMSPAVNPRSVLRRGLPR